MDTNTAYYEKHMKSRLTSIPERCLGLEHQTRDITNTEDVTLTLTAHPLPRAASERFRGKSDENEGSGHTLENRVQVVDSAHLPVHTPTVKRKEYHSSIRLPTKSKSHRFFLMSFTAPTKCHQCTSLMVGLIRQGCACDACGFSCHTSCVEKAPRACPVPSQQKKGALCLDAPAGMGTAYEGRVWIPKKAEARKGWQRALAVICDFKLFLYNMDEEKDSKPNVVVSQVIDMR
ncbi:serine/threonine-protein kinase MRCK alpha-like [Lutra lutra]|uniref:serine/threonine-protein kinase MRCK alpha-like n=1 Tax=Lutra lutra TaxID=9657 RepID=UPI001FD03B0D|nr:serine/threonine-protein kinase MRCK alpha-like [Lutra lutra]